jgi:hypothetical protein
VRAAVGDTLTDQEIRSLLVRRDLLIKEIDAQIRAQGKTNVVYD